MPQSMALPCLALTALFSFSAASPSSASLNPRMEMPDSPPPPPSSPPTTTYWNFATNGLPVSYRVAIIIDAFVLIVTIVSLCLLGWYMRNQYRRRKLQQLIHEQRIEEGRKIGGERRDGRRGRKEGRKGKGHVRWGSNVQGGSVDLDEMDMDMDMGQEGKGKAYTVSERRIDVFTPEPKRVNPLGGIGMGIGIDKAKASPMVAEFRGDPLGKGKGVSLWEEEREMEMERHHRRVGKGEDGF